MYLRFFLSLVLAGNFLVAVGCGGDDDDKADDPSKVTIPVEESVSEKVTAALGATVATETETAAMKIPAGALAADTTITIDSSDKNLDSDKTKLGSNIYDIGPSGTQFAKPVTLTLELGVSVPSGKKAQIAVYSDGEWSPIEGSTVSGKEVSADIEHLSKYVILFVGDDIEITTAGCDNASFSACGGTLTGTWNVRDVCYSATITDANPYASIKGCEKVKYEVDAAFTGTITFKADGTYTSVFDYSGTGVTFEFPESCLTAMGATCDNLKDAMGNCTYGQAVCKCSEGADSSDTETENGTYTTKDGILTITSSSDTSSSSDPSEDEGMKYCVKGSTATLGISEDSDGGVPSTAYIMLDKK